MKKYTKYTIIFPLDDHKTVKEKLKIIEKIAGEDNVSYSNDIDEYSMPSVVIRCKKKTWKEIKFHLDLTKAYW